MFAAPADGDCTPLDAGDGATEAPAGEAVDGPTAKDRRGVESPGGTPVVSPPTGESISDRRSGVAGRRAAAASPCGLGSA